MIHMNVEHAVFSAGLAAEGGVGGVFQGGQVAVFRWKSAVAAASGAFSSLFATET